MTKQFAVYIATNKHNTVLYTGVTNNLPRRAWEHKEGTGSKFTKKYRVSKIVYYELFDNPKDAIEREKQIKAGSRKKKVYLIKKENPEYDDLYTTINK